MDEPISCTITAESTAEGTIHVSVRAIDGVTDFHLARVVLTLTVRDVDRETVRLIVMNPRTGRIAYLQGGLSAFEFARDIGLGVAP